TRDEQRFVSQSELLLRDNTDRVMWSLSNDRGEQFKAGSVLFALQPPDTDALNLLESLRTKYAGFIDRWALRSRKLRVPLITATLAVLQAWDYETYCAMREPEIAAILTALEEDIDKLAREGK